MAALLSGGLRPVTSGVNLTLRPASLPTSQQLNPIRNSTETARSRTRVNNGAGQDDPTLTANSSLSVIEVENLLRKKVRRKITDLQQAFNNYDAEQRFSVTKGEFRRVLESYCFPMTSEQFEAVVKKVLTKPNGTICYTDFLDKFYGTERPSAHVEIFSLAEKAQLTTFPGGQQRTSHDRTSLEINMEVLEKDLREKINQNLKNVIKGLRLYDYNRDGLVQKHELRKVLENYCLKMTDQQYEKIYHRYDFQHRGVINYKEFLTRLGIAVDQRNKSPPSNTAGGVMSWQEFQQQKLNQHQRALRKSESNAIAGMSIDQIETLFRKKMRENYVNLKRMFMVFDPHLDGCVMLEDLRSILSQFTIPLSEAMFLQLMDRFQIKASGKISWEFFLEKFQDPQSHGNGQTVPIKPSHRFFPVRGVRESMDTIDVLKLLFNHVKNAYPSYKQAFLELDKNRNGNISRKQLRRVLDTFQFELTDDQFRELMILLDPQHTNFISYHMFLNLFEERETNEGHKWLKSVHRFNDKPKPAVLPWKSIEEILKEKISENWSEISAVIVSYDSSGSGHIHAKELRKILERFVVPLSDDHFQNLLSKAESQEGGKVNYIQFLTKLGVSVRPGDLQGLSWQIHEQSASREQDRQKDHKQMEAAIDQRILEHTDSMTPEEILCRIRDRISQHSTHIHKAFHSYDRRGKGKISKKDFRKVMESFGMALSDDSFKALCAQLNFHNGYMLYSDFVRSFEDPRPGGPSKHLSKVNNHKVNPVRGDEYGLTAEQIEAKLRSKLRENFEDLRGAFYKFDDDHNGILTKPNFRRMLDSFMCITKDSEFEKLCQHLGIEKNTRISYPEFLDYFEVRDTVEGHKWLISDHKYNAVFPIQSMTADQVHKALVKKAHQQYKDLAKAFLAVDSNNSGLVTKNELREALYNFVLPITSEEFAKLWKRYDVKGKGHLDYHDFLKQLTVEEFAPGDQEGTSKKIIDNSIETIERHHQDQRNMQEQITQNQVQHCSALNTDQLIVQLKDRIRDQFSDFHETFKKYDKKQKGYLTVSDIQKVLIDFNYFLDDDQFYDLLQRLKMNQPKSRLTYESFLEVFEEGRKENYEPKPQSVTYPLLNNHDQLSPEEAERKMKEMIALNADVVQKACQAFDKDFTCYMMINKFRRVLDNFCFKMTDKQFKHLSGKLESLADGRFNYMAILQEIRPAAKAGEEDSENFFTNPEKWLQKVEQHCGDSEPRELSMEEVRKYISEYVKANYFSISRALSEADYANIGVVTKDDFRSVLNKHTIRLSEEQFEKLWNSSQVNEFGNLDYHAFLRLYCSDESSLSLEGPPATARQLRTAVSSQGRPSTSLSDLSRSRTRLSRLSGDLQSLRPFTPLVNAENVEAKLKVAVCNQWKDIQKQCRLYDPEDTGEIKDSEFKAVLGHFHIQLKPNDLETLLTKYDLKNSGMFRYSDFLRHFVLSVRPQKKPNMLSRDKEGSPEGKESNSGRFQDANRRLKTCVVNNWKEMRQLFRSMDQQGKGKVSHLDFRLVLKSFSVNLSEEEFHFISSSYDKNSEGLISFNDFIGAFLRNT